MRTPAVLFVFMLLASMPLGAANVPTFEAPWTQWITTTAVEVSPGGPLYPHLALDSQDRPQFVGFFGGKVAFAERNGATWTYESFPLGGGWAAAPEVLVLDALDQPHIIYRENGPAGGYWYASRNGGSWTKEHILPPDSSRYEESLHVDSGTGVVQFLYTQLTPASDGPVLPWLATRSAGAWEFRQLPIEPRSYQSTTTAFDSAGYPAVFRVDTNAALAQLLRFDGSAWRNETVPGAEVCTSDVHLSLELEDAVHLACRAWPAAVHYFSNSTGAWVHENPSYLTTGTVLNYRGIADMAIAPDGQPHVLIWINVDVGVCAGPVLASTIRYATRTVAGWFASDVQAVRDDANTCSANEREASIALDSRGLPRVVHIPENSKEFRYAFPPIAIETEATLIASDLVR